MHGSLPAQWVACCNSCTYNIPTTSKTASVVVDTAYLSNVQNIVIYL
jgi:hypothetical protein